MDAAVRRQRLRLFCLLRWPLATATGAGAESCSQIGCVIVGGISFGTLFTRFVVPTAYTLLARTRRLATAEQGAPEEPITLPERQAAE